MLRVKQKKAFFFAKYISMFDNINHIWLLKNYNPNTCFKT